MSVKYLGIFILFVISVVFLSNSASWNWDHENRTRNLCVGVGMLLAAVILWKL